MNRFDDIVARHLREEHKSDEAAADRVLARLQAPLPMQRHSFFEHWPSVLLNLDFAPSWPRLAMLASVALVGCMVGLLAPGTQIIPRSNAATIQIADSDATTFGFEPEPITGVRP